MEIMFNITLRVILTSHEAVHIQDFFFGGGRAVVFQDGFSV